MHEERIDQIQQHVRSVAKERINRSQAIQVALLAFQPTSDLKKFVDENKAADLRRRSARGKTR